MRSRLQSLLDRVAELPGKVPELFSHPAPSSSSIWSQMVEDLEELRRKMGRILVLLNAAEEREVREETVRLWLYGLWDVAYDTDDVVEDVEYELLRYNLVREEEEERRTKRKCMVISDPHAAPSCPLFHESSSSQQQIITKIRTINDLLEDIYLRGLELDLLLPVQQGQIAMGVEPWRRPTMSRISVVDEQGVCRREDDRRKVMDLLLCDDVDHDVHSGENVLAVSIVGVGGVGKTFLAQLIFKDDAVVNHFDKLLWVCVSDAFDVTRLTRQILKQLRGSCPTSELEDFNSLQETLHKELKGNRFLLVLDDVWNENAMSWEALWFSLLSGAQGSRVLITTRSEKVSRISHVSAKGMYRLGRLSEEDSWLLFEKHAFGGVDSGKHPNLVAIGRQIMERCEGLPLSLKMLAGLRFCRSSEHRRVEDSLSPLLVSLSSNFGRWPHILTNRRRGKQEAKKGSEAGDPSPWVDILTSDLWQVGKDLILPTLKLSYYHLPSHVKPCFTYCALFPKDYKFDKDELVFLWLAQDLITPCSLDVGRECFQVLVRRSFFQQSGDGRFQMHDLIHDLALHFRGRECSRLEEDGRLSDACTKPRHLWFEHRTADEATFLSSTDNFPQSLRTCYLISDSCVFPDASCALSTEVRIIDDMFQSMKYLRALCLYGWEIGGLPDSLGNLKHLRYLSIRRMVKLTKLPETLGNLLNLQTLEVLDAFDLEELPNSLGDLLNLRHLIVGMPQDFYSLPMMPCGIGRLTQLQTLRRFVVGEGVCAAGIEELEALDELRGELIINVRSLSNCMNVGGGGGGGGNRKKVAILKQKSHLKSLVLEFSDDWGTCGDQSLLTSMKAEEFIEIVQPHQNIQELVIDGYMGRGFPKWMAYSSYFRLETIRLESCRSCTHLPALGMLPSLKHLDVRFMDELRSVGHEFCGDRLPGARSSFFPALKQLRFYCLPECRELSLAAFPHLDLLQIEDCQKLRYIRLMDLHSLSELHIARCDKLTKLELQPQLMGSNLHTIRLEFCQKVNLPWKRQWLPSSLRRFEVTGSPLLEEWARRHLNT